MMSTLVLLAAATAGFLAWGFVEYLVHGILSHRYRTFVSPLHLGHHREPRAVFTSPIALALATNPGLAAAAVGGLLMGFGRYEYVHWRIHFREPRSTRERHLRSHHLAHHFRNPRAYHGVTTRLWDRVFGTLPERWREDYARVEARAPLEGPSNFRWCYAPSGALRELTQVRHRLRARTAGARRGPGALTR
jgi:sterol desaturase/sphingolipid hydroxylase (fatty acid hydroxylase superfamily)